MRRGGFYVEYLRGENVNILIVSANRARQPVAVMPVGACMAAGAAERAGHSVKMLDLMFEKNPGAALERELEKAVPDVVGISVRNIDNNDMKNPAVFFKEAAFLTALVKTRTKAAVVLGGAAVTVLPEQLLRYCNADLAVAGNGEIVFPRLLSALSCGGSPSEIPGVCFLKNNSFVKNENPVSPARSACLPPDFSRWIDIKSYLAELAAAPVRTKIGCPFNCVYCTYAVSEGKIYSLLPAEDVLDNIRGIIAGGIHDIEFVDNVFNSPYDHAMEICGALAGAGLNARFHTVEINPGFLDDALLSAMEKAGFAGIGITAESASDQVLAGLGKNYRSEDVRRAAEAVRRHETPCFWIFMLGGPGETRETVMETLRFAERFIKPSDTAFFNAGVRIYPGTKLEVTARKEGVLAVPPEEMLSPVFYLSPAVDSVWLFETLGRFCGARRNFIGHDSLSLPFLPALSRLAHVLGLRPPLWKHTRAIRSGLALLGVKS